MVWLIFIVNIGVGTCAATVGIAHVKNVIFFILCRRQTNTADIY